MFRSKVAVFALAAACLGGCASATPEPVQVNAALGKVVVYRNGVAYFERTAVLRDDKLTITVPAERVDDFLKSLTVVDAKTGKSLPVSFPSMDAQGDETVMTIQLPKGSSGRLKISYVTESPAWKPSYRVVLKDDGPAQLEAWAVVDNVSGEDWKKVSVGVGSTSALSFRYDLHSIRFVERETLSDGQPVALAPPTGGSPYAVASGEVQVIGNISADDLTGLEAPMDKKRPEATADAEASGAGANTAWANREVQKKVAKRRKKHPRSESMTRGGTAGLDRAPSPRIYAQVERIRRQAASGKKVVIEGFAKSGDKDPRNDSLSRANVLRDALINQGVRADQIEAVGTGRNAGGQGVRVLMKADQPQSAQAQQQKSASGKSDEPIGSAYFLAKAPMTIEDGHSAMVSLLSTGTEAKQVYYFDPVSNRGSKRFAFRAVLLKNPSKYTLDAGPFTVYADGQFLGEGLSEPIPPGSEAFIPYGMDRKLVVEPESTSREEIDSLVTIERGIVTAEAQRIRRTKLTLHNRGQSAATVYVRHAVPKGWKLRDTKVDFEKLRGAHLFPVTVPGKSAAELVIEEAMPVQKTVDIRTEAGVTAMSLFLRDSSKVNPKLRDRIQEVIEMHREMVDLQERIDTIHRQMNEYRARVDELNLQLVTLRKVNQAAKLKRHLAQKMEEISERLQKSTIDVTDLEGQLLTHRISLQDRLAELSLKKREERVARVPAPKE